MLSCTWRPRVGVAMGGLLCLLAKFFIAGPTLGSDLCWKTSDPRGAATIPKSCTGGKENQTGLCYNECEQGQEGDAFLCWTKCPADWTDRGVGTL